MEKVIIFFRAETFVIFITNSCSMSKNFTTNFAGTQKTEILAPIFKEICLTLVLIASLKRNYQKVTLPPIFEVHLVSCKAVEGLGTL